ncbi:MAG: cupredoxin domain-containing protein, partial [Immundisolibacteraceae bacterium]|nr:cupredoxin domain-containing protein [Immundisolibacteraceae bacterium]
MIWFINLAGVGLIGLIVWWFWLYRLAEPDGVATSGVGKQLIITVADGVYQPDRIQLTEGQPIQLRFLRKDPSPCAEMVLFDGLNISQQ